ncbi:stage III sporulation protein AF [Cohnella hongkongensis]|uniref:Stage III sporulation protein AF n=1 Tax=Cohnella hongkongensis TaxID=178337 RepID=A0ABV9FG93_9BACL
MDMMEGLSGWLRQVIAVILLASLIDLLLPNRTMQRYVRLVAGLFILLTVATPVIQWIKGDFGSKLSEGLQAVESTPAGAPRQLAMIEAEGAKLRESRLAQAADLAAARLESEIRSEVERTGERAVRRVDVDLEKVSDGSLAVAKVSIELEPDAAAQAAEAGASGAGGDPIREVEVEAVADVEIEVEVGGAKTRGDEPNRTVMAGENGADGELDRATRMSVKSLVSERFGLAPGIVEVKLPGEV